MAFDLKDYADIDHGYAATIHKAQGVTLDRAHILASSGLDRHAAYVALTRHRDGVELHYGADQFRDGAELARTLGRERAKDTTLDYDRERFAARRGLEEPIRVPAQLQAPERKGRFDGLRLGRDRSGMAGPAHQPTPAELLDARVRDYARAHADVERMERAGLTVLRHQTQALADARTAFDRRDPGLAQDIETAFRRSPGLADRIDQPGGMEAIRKAARTELALRTNAERRAARFMEAWRGLQAEHGRLSAPEQRRAQQGVEVRMARLVSGLERDPQLESILQGRRRELGLGAGIGRPRATLGAELVRSLGLGQRRGLGLER